MHRPWTLFILCFAAAAACSCSSSEDGSRGAGPDAGSPDATDGAHAGGSAGSAGMAGSGPAGAAGAAGAGGPSGAGGDAGVALTDCQGKCHYVRADASGTSDGSDWNNAWKELPAELQRGHVYFVATGEYSGAQLDDAASGEKTRILRATSDDHGTATGWTTALATGEAVFGALHFSSPGWEVDGRGATRVEGAFQGSAVTIGAGRVELRNLDVDGGFLLSDGKHTAGACTGLSISGDGVVVQGVRIHNAADDGVSISGSTHLSFVGNRVYDLHGCGTDGGCGPCYNGHSDGLEIYNVKDSEFVGNLVYGIQSTSAFFLGNWADLLGGGPSEYCENLLLANNVLYSWDTGFIAYIEDAKNVQFLNNTVWGHRQGAYGGLSIGKNVSGLSMVNNIILSVNFAHIGGAFDASKHSGDYNLFGASLGQWHDGPHDLVAPDPGLTAIPEMNGAKVDYPEPEMFVPKAASPVIDKGTPGDATTPVPSTDYFGKARGLAPDIGAVESSL